MTWCEWEKSTKAVLLAKQGKKEEKDSFTLSSDVEKLLVYKTKAIDKRLSVDAEGFILKEVASEKIFLAEVFELKKIKRGIGRCPLSYVSCFVSFK